MDIDKQNNIFLLKKLVKVPNKNVIIENNYNTMYSTNTEDIILSYNQKTNDRTNEKISDYKQKKIFGSNEPILKVKIEKKQESTFKNLPVKRLYVINDRKINKDTFTPPKKEQKIPSNKTIYEYKVNNNKIYFNDRQVIENEITEEKNKTIIKYFKNKENQIIKYIYNCKILFHIDILLLFEKDNLIWIINYINFLNSIDKNKIYLLTTKNIKENVFENIQNKKNIQFILNTDIINYIKIITLNMIKFTSVIIIY